MPKYSDFVTLNQGESYSSIFKFLTAEAYFDQDLIGILDSQIHHP
jgi:hypothetical protein